jgi:hypothetical protein
MVFVGASSNARRLRIMRAARSFYFSAPAAVSVLIANPAAANAGPLVISRRIAGVDGVLGISAGLPVTK